MFRCVVAALFAGLVVCVAGSVRAAPPVEAYARLPAMADVTLSPSGARYAYVTVDGETRKLVAATVDGNQALFASDIGKAKIVRIDWAGDDHLLVQVSHTASLGPEFAMTQLEFSAVIAINVTTGRAISVFSGNETVLDAVFNVAGTARVNGRWYGYFGGITLKKGLNGYAFDHGYPDLYRVDLDTGDTSIAARGGESSHDWLVGPDGSVIARALYHQKTGDWAVAAGDAAGDPLTSGRDPIEGPSLLARGKTPEAILIEQPSDQGDVYVQAPLSGAPREVVGDGVGISEPLFDRNTRLWIGQIAEGDMPETTMFDAAVNGRMQSVRRAFPGLSARLVSFDASFNRLMVFTSGTGDSGTYWLVDVAGHKANPLGYEYPDVQPADVGSIQMVTWKAADGLELHGVLSLPPGRAAKNLPVIVMPHGGPQARDYPVFDWWAQVFASRGYAVFQPNFRGSDGYGGSFRDAGFGQWGRKMQTDVSDGLAELARQGVVDPKRACIVGWSYGGYAALAGVTVQNGLYRCAVSMAGVSDLSSFLSYEADKQGSISATMRYWKRFMGDTSAFGGGLGSISPAALAGHADAPVLLVHGRDDTVVPFAQSVEMADALKRAGKPVSFVSLDGADHWLLREDTRIAMAKASAAFVLKYDPPDPPAVQASSATATSSP
ncbi:MAG TPA: S9 family peptidase [Caulobacteraceae bacterium]|jgi:dienelactone hydrolase|nr:S9 family peptidase [Caulobacteraceae bacterium]